jgi:hypothetical protein
MTFLPGHQGVWSVVILTTVCVSFFGNEDTALGAYLVAISTMLYVLVAGPGRAWLARKRAGHDDGTENV